MSPQAMSEPSGCSCSQPATAGRASPRFRRTAFTMMAALLIAPLAGCPGPTVAGLQAEIARKDDQLGRQDQQLAAYDSTIKELRQRLLRAQGLDPDRWERAFRPVDLTIASLSGGADYDGKPGDDGVNVYLRPIDRDGDVVKVAGEIRVRLYDLANPQGRELIGEYGFPADESGDYWYGKLMTQHFTVKCPWPSAPPKHEEITIRATFVDGLTGNVMTAQGTCKVELAP